MKLPSHGKDFLSLRSEECITLKSCTSPCSPLGLYLILILYIGTTALPKAWLVLKTQDYLTLMSPSEWLCSRHLLENSNLSRWKLLPAKANLRHLISEKSHRNLKFVSSLSCWVMSDSLRPSKLQPTRYLYPWDFLGKNTGVGYHFLLQGISLGQGLNLRPLHWQADSLPRSHQGSPMPKFTNNLIGFFFFNVFFATGSQNIRL